MLQRLEAGSEILPKFKPEPADLFLTDDQMLIREVDTPKLSQKKAMGMLELNLRQAFPEKSEGLVWRAIRRPGLGYRQYVVKVEFLERVKRACVRYNLGIRTIRIGSAPELTPIFDNRKSTDRAVHHWWGLAAFATAAACAVLVLQVTLAQIEARRYLQERHTFIAELRDQVVGAHKDSEEQSEQFLRVAQQVRIFNAQAVRLPILIGLTDILSDDVWISELAISEQTLRLSGFTTTNVAKLIDLLKSLDWVESVDLNAPVSFDRRTSQNRFEIDVSLSMVEIKS